MARVPMSYGGEIRSHKSDGRLHERYRSENYVSIKSRPTLSHRYSSAPVVLTHSGFSKNGPFKRYPVYRHKKGCTVVQSQNPLEMYETTPDPTTRPRESTIQNETQLTENPLKNDGLTRLADPTMPVSERELPALAALPIRQDSTDSLSKPRVAFKFDSSPKDVIFLNSDPPPALETEPKSDPHLTPPHWRMDSDSESDGPGGDQVPFAFTEEWQYIKGLRLSTLSLASQIHERRGTLREKQDARSRAYDQLLQQVRMKELGVTSTISKDTKEFKTILELADDCQKTHNEYGPLEDDCNRLEDQLYAQEFELHRLEELFYSRWDVVPNPTSGHPMRPPAQVVSPRRDNSGDEEERPNHPLVEELLSKREDLDLRRERLDEIKDEVHNLEDRSQIRQRVGLSLGQEEQTWLDDSQRIQDELNKEIRDLGLEVERLQQECFERNLVDEDGEPTDFRTQETESITEGIESHSQSHTIQGQALVESRGLEKEVEEWKQDCLSKHLANESEKSADFQLKGTEKFTGSLDSFSQASDYSTAFTDDDGLDSGSQTSQYSRHSVLLPTPCTDDQQIIPPKPSEKPFTIASRINAWLLERLRHSPLDVNLLARTFETEGGEPSDQWQTAVLDLWYWDDTLKGWAGFRVYTSSMTTQAPLHSKRSSNSSDLSDSGYHFRLPISLSLQFASHRSDETELAGIAGSSPVSPRVRFETRSQ